MYRKELYVLDGKKPIKAVIRQYTYSDFEDLIRVQKEAFPPPFPEELWWNNEQLTNHVELFPDGALCIEIDGRISGSMTGLIVNILDSDQNHSWAEITDNGYIKNHDHEGNTLYIVDICISPFYRKLGLGKLLMQSMYETVVYLGLERLLGGGRLPGYHLHSDELSIEQYIVKVMNGDINDPVISFLLRCGRIPVRPIENYLEDEESLNYGMLMEWRNPFKHKTLK